MQCDLDEAKPSAKKRTCGRRQDITISLNLPMLAKKIKIELQKKVVLYL